MLNISQNFKITFNKLALVKNLKFMYSFQIFVNLSITYRSLGKWLLAMVQKGAVKEIKYLHVVSEKKLPGIPDSRHSQRSFLVCLLSWISLQCFYNPTLISRAFLSHQDYLHHPVLWCSYECMTSITLPWQNMAKGINIFCLFWCHWPKTENGDSLP